MALHYGNVHLLLTFLQLWSFYYAMRGRDTSSALLLAAAITIKIIPILTLPYFVIKKRWNLVALTCVFVIVLNIIPSIHFGFIKNSDLLKTWYEHVVLNQESHERDSWINLSLKGQLRRYLTRIDYSQRAAGTGNTDTDYRTVHVASLSPETANRLWLGTSAVFYLCGLTLVWWGGWHKKELIVNHPNTQQYMGAFSLERTQSMMPLEYGFLICIILLMGPLTPKIYFVQLLLPVACLMTYALSHQGRASQLSRYVLFFIAAINLTLPLLPGRSIQRLLLVIGVDFYLAILLMGVIASALFAHYKQMRRVCLIPSKNVGSR